MNNFYKHVIIIFLCAAGCNKALAQTSTYSYFSDSVQSFTVPSGASYISVDVKGAEGGGTECGGSYHYQSKGGCGGRVQATIAVTVGHVLHIIVGGAGSGGSGTVAAGGYGGGGSDNIYSTTWPGAGGGGGTTIIDSNTGDTLVVAGGGGGGGGDVCALYSSVGDKGGAGGGLVADSGYANICGTTKGGKGGRQYRGGLGSNCTYTGQNGAYYKGGNCVSGAGFGSGGGGGGYYGGGAGADGAGGGGGSSYTNPTYAASVIHTKGNNCGGGSASISITCLTGRIIGTDTLCIGSATTLSDTTAGGTWTSSTTTIATIDSSGVVTAIGAGVDTILYATSSCTVTQLFKVEALPTATVSGTDSLCSGGTSHIIFSGPAGTIVAYNINGGATLHATTNSFGTIGVSTGVLYTNTTYNLTGAANPGCSVSLSDSFIITINPPKHNISGDSSVCVRSTTTLAGSPTGGSWSSASPLVATVGSGSGIVRGISSGTAVVSYAAFFTGCLAVTTVTVNPSPSALSAISICPGTIDSAGSMETATGGTWMISADSIATVDSVTGVITGVMTGSTTLTYTLPTGCAVTAPVRVYFFPVPITGASSVCVGSSTTLTDTSLFAGAHGTWSSSNAAIASITAPGGTTGAATDAVRGTGAGTATITYTLPSGCAATTTITVNPRPAGVTGARAVCAGLSITLSDSSTGGAFSTADTSIAGIDSLTGVVTGLSAGTAVISYTLPTGSCTIKDTITVNPLPYAITGHDSVCAGHATTLTSTSAGGTWTSGAPGIATVNSSGTVIGISAGTSSITHTLSTGCFNSVTVTVDLSPAPIAGPTTVCVGSAISLTDTPTTGGTWSTSGTGRATIDSVSGTLTGITAGGTIVTYTLLIGSCATTDSITVNPLPSVITGPDSVCKRSTLSLSSAPAGGRWSSMSAATASIDSLSGIATGLMAGTDTISYTLNTGCTETRQITVNSLPGVINGPGTVCAGSIIDFNNDTTGGTWSSSPAGTATIDPLSGVLAGITAGPATVTYTIPTGCISTDSIRVEPLPGVIAGADSVCIGQVTTLTDTLAGGMWSSSDTTIATIDSSGNVSGIAAGSVTISYVSGSGCPATTGFVVHSLPLSITGTFEVCVNAMVTLSDSSTSGTWSTAAVAVATIDPLTGILTGVSSGTVTVYYTLPTGCYASITEKIDTIPEAIGGTLQVCANGATTYLTEAITPGTWSITPLSTATISSTGTVTGLTAGSATVTYTLPVTSCYITAPVTVNPLPLPITGTSTVCVASYVHLHDATSGGGWSAAPISIATVNVSGYVTGVSAGTATVTYTLPTGCAVTDTVTVNPQPAAVIIPLGDTMICPGSFADLTANTGLGLTYQWYDPFYISGATTSTYLAGVSGNYKVKVTNSYGCSLVSSNISVRVNPATASIVGGGTTTCAGTPLVLYANLGTGLSYQWQRDSVSIAGAVDSVYGVSDSSGNYSVIVSNSTGCSASSNVIAVTVYPSPADSITASGPLTFCYGGSVLLSGVDTGYSYQWYNLSGGAIAGATNINYTATSSDTYYQMAGNSYGCTTLSGGISVVSLSLPGSVITEFTATTFCEGDSVVLNGPVGGGDSYQWYTGGVAIAGATNQTYTDSVSGNFTVVVVGPTGCIDSTTIATTITEVATPVVMPLTPTSFCWGASATLSADVVSVAGGVTYQWYYDSVAISGATGAVYSTSRAGSYSCKVSLTTSMCSVITVPVTITEHPLPNPLVTFDGAMFHTGNFYTAYQWYKNLVSVTGGTTYETPATGDGNYEVAVTDTNGCQSVSDLYVLTALGVGNVAPGQVKIYPNPAQIVLHISSATVLRAQINGVDGRALISQDHAQDIDISGLADGVYMIMLYDSNGQMVKAEKVIKASN